MIEELIKRIFTTRDCAHMTHWQTNSYAEHQALSKFYNDVIDLLDDFVEVYQGNFEKVDNLSYLDTIEDKILKQLENDIKWMEKNYNKLTYSITPLKNILDEILACYLKTIYKLRFLK